eukprot:11438765-Prorocentrum_lima.AAC.1
MHRLRVTGWRRWVKFAFSGFAGPAHRCTELCERWKPTVVEIAGGQSALPHAVLCDQASHHADLWEVSPCASLLGRAGSDEDTED